MNRVSATETVQVKDFKNWYPQLPCLTFNKKNGQCEASTVCGRQVDWLKLDLGPKGSLVVSYPRELGDYKCNYNYFKTNHQLMNNFKNV